jgi:hypothetical protein
MGYSFNDFEIPDRMMPEILGYIQNGIHPGDFLTAVICNDLRAAVAAADLENMRNLPAFAGYFYNRAPFPCAGSAEKMRDWMALKQEAANDHDHV